MTKKQVLSFPKRFLWGAATSAHQVEGGTHNQWSTWELENANVRATQAPHHWDDLDNWSQIAGEAKKAKTYISGKAADHFTRYREDFDLLDAMNMNAFRFSIEWSRVEPQEGAWDAAAVEHYKAYVAELKRRGIEPIVTLFHFTLPEWFAAKGGFEKRANVQYFVRYAERIVRELGLSARHIITINEPKVYADESYLHGHWPPEMQSKWQYYRVLQNLAAAHKQAARAIHGVNRRYKVAVAYNSAYFYPGDDAWLSRVSAQILQWLHDDYFLRKVARHCDYLGVNYYFSNRVYGYRVHNPEKEVSDMGWDASPSDIQYALERLHHRYNLPMIVTESGIADADDSRRQWWITQTLAGLRGALDSGVDVRGYLHWSLLDTFEWDKGTWPRFGLAAVDYGTQQRTLRASAVWFGKVIAHIRKGQK